MAISLGVGPSVVGVVGAGTGASTVVFTLTGTTAGRSLVVGVCWASPATISSITCNGESNLTVHGSPVNHASIGIYSQIASLANITTGGTKTITVTFSSTPSYRSGYAVELIGGDTSNWFGAVSSGTGTSANPSIAHTTAANAAFIASIMTNVSPPTAGSNYTFVPLGTTYQFGEYDLDAGAAGAKTVDYTNATSDAWAIAAASFNALGPGARFALPIVTLEGVGQVAGAQFNLPVLTVFAANSGAKFNLPVLTLSAAADEIFYGTASFGLPALTLSAAARIEGNGISSFPLPFTTLSATGLTGGAASAEFNLPVLSIEIVAYQHGLGNAAFDLPVLRFSASGETGGVGTAAFDLPALTLVMAAVQSITGTAAFNLPLVFLDAQGAFTLGETYRTWILNTRKLGLTEYSNFNFNSFALFNGQYLACGPAGVVVLGTQALDGATEITGRFRTGKPNFDSAWVKRVPRLYMDFSCSGDMLFRTLVSETGTRTYKLVSNKITTLQQRRVPIGKGPKSVHWQFEGENVLGSDFTVSNIMAYPTALRRRVSG